MKTRADSHRATAAQHAGLIGVLLADDQPLIRSDFREAAVAATASGDRPDGGLPVHTLLLRMAS